jgi:hypothetical protein
MRSRNSQALDRSPSGGVSGSNRPVPSNFNRTATKPEENNMTMSEAESELELEKVTVDCCVICKTIHYLPEMSECPKCGYFCMKCDCPCPVLSENELAAA